MSKRFYMGKIGEKYPNECPKCHHETLSCVHNLKLSGWLCHSVCGPWFRCDECGMSTDVHTNIAANRFDNFMVCGVCVKHYRIPRLR